MTYIRRLILAFVLSCGMVPAFAQAPAPVPALPDTERRTSYSISTSTCACAVNFQLYGDGTDFNNWVEVFLNGTLVNYNDPTFGWTITSPSGSLAAIARPITNAVLTFTSAQTGTVQIVGARRPRRISQFSENRGVSARDLNQAFTDIIAQNRETWDKTNDVTGRAVIARPGEILAMLPPVSGRASMNACFDSFGNLTSCVAAGAGSFSAGANITFTGSGPTTISLNGFTAFGLSFGNALNVSAAWGILGVIPCAQTEAFTGDVTKASGSCATTINYTSPATGGVARTMRSKFAESISVTDFGAVCDGTTDDTTAIAAAFTAGASKKVTFPPGVICKVKGSGTAVFAITAPIIIDCQGAQILLDATTPNTRNLLVFAPTGAGDRLPSRRVTRCLFNMNGVGAATIIIDTTATNTTEIGEFEIDHCRDSASGTTTGTNASIFVNNIGTNTNGGTFNVNFHDNVWSNGIYLNSAGDSIRIRDSILSGSKYGVYAALITGAAGLIIEGNNISAADPILIDAALGPINIINNEFEQQITSTDPNGAVVNLRGGTAQLGLVTFTGNSINALAGTGSPNPLRIANVAAAYVESNSFVSGVAGSACIVNATGAAATIIGASNQWSGCTTHVSATVAVKYVQVGLTP